MQRAHLNFFSPESLKTQAENYIKCLLHEAKIQVVAHVGS